MSKEALKQHKPPEPLLSQAEREQFQNPGWLLVMSGPRGVGKDTVMRKFQERPGIIAPQIVTYASRSPRDGEIDGVDYNFVSKAEFEEKIKAGFFAEYVEVGGYKGTQRDPFKAVLQGENRIWRIDPTRAATVDHFYNQVFVTEEAQILAHRTLTVYVGVNSLQTIKSRFQKRSPEKWADKDEREGFLANLRKEWTAWNQTGTAAFDYVLMNDGLVDSAVNELEQLISSQFGPEQSLMPVDQYGNYEIRQPEY